MRFITYKDSIDYFYNNKFKNEYEIKTNDGIYSTHNSTINIEKLSKIKRINDNIIIQIVNKKAIDRFHPNNINNKHFWEYAKTKFPKFSICGSKSKTLKDVNEQNLIYAKCLESFNFLNYLVNNYPNLNILEIGFGYGNVFNEIKKKCNYIGIDYTIPKKLYKNKNLYTIDKSGVPDHLFKIDFYNIIYSINVLQHCSQKDRFQYISEAYSLLRPNGYFIFSCFIMTENNKNDKCFGMKDKNGRGYCNFFNQLTEVDMDYELIELINRLEFKTIYYEILNTNYLSCILQK